MTLPSQQALTNGAKIIESKESFIESIPLPFASVAFSDNYHLALLRNLHVDGGMVVFSRPPDSYYVSSAVGFPPIIPSTEVEIARFSKRISNDRLKFNGNVLRLQKEVVRYPRMQTLLNQSGYQYLRIYRVNDFLATSGYWLMFFRKLKEANSAGLLINRSLSSPQFHDSITELVNASTNEEALDEIVDSWVNLLDKRDKETKEHTRRVADLAVKLAQRLGFSGERLKNFRRGALLHDIGKIVIPDEILLKPGALSESEWKIMRLHPRIVKDLLKEFEIPDEVMEIPSSHHEKWDGSGYPNGLRGEAIPLSARIFSIVDVWDAMLVDRPYRKKFPRPQVVDYIQNQQGKHFDPQVTETFMQMVATGI
ncbi:MAG: HD domain-containing protein [Anaerolineales bacterium]|nr:HD domain-containing protein [Anaerolineales bacterium]